MRLRWLAYVAGGLVALAVATYAAFALSPWPTVLLIRQAFSADASSRNRALEKLLPPDVTVLRDEPYAPGAVMDVFMPSAAATAGQTLPAVVWVHGGGFVAGNKSDVAPYLHLLAARGFVTVGVGYALAPSARYPGPVLQANEALGFLVRNAARFHIDPARLFVAGDSAGAQIVAQLAAGIADPAYAKAVGFTPAVTRDRLKGAVLFCGVYDTARLDDEGPFGDFFRVTMWAYFGSRAFAGDPRFKQFAVLHHLGPKFPPAFISVGNADPLAPQSVALAEALRAQGVATDTLFFPDNRSPALRHEYQFEFDTDAGRQALDRLAAFLTRAAP